MERSALGHWRRKNMLVHNLTHIVWQQTAIHTHSCHVSCSIDRIVFYNFFWTFNFTVSCFTRCSAALLRSSHAALLRSSHVKHDCRQQLTFIVWQLTTINTFSYTFHFGWWAGTYFSFFLDFHKGRTFTNTVSCSYLHSDSFFRFRVVLRLLSRDFAHFCV